MDGVLDGATLLCICKLACSLPFVSSLSITSLSPVSFCCCCLLLFTDLLLTVFLSVFCILEHWQTELISTPSTGDVIALRLLLFISHTYGAVFVLTLPVVTTDTVIRLLQQKSITTNTRQKVENPLSYIVGYLCCLSIWIYSTLNIRWRWKLEEVWTATCLYTTNTLLTCLPNMLSPMLRFLAPIWALVLCAFVMFLTISKFPTRQASTHKASPSNSDPNTVFDDKVTSYKVKISECVYEDLGLVSHGCSNGEEIEPKVDSTEQVIPLTFITEIPMKPECGSQWAFPCLGGNHVMIGVVCTLVLFVLPLNLSVNIYLISSIDRLLELSLKSFMLSKSVKNKEII